MRFRFIWHTTSLQWHPTICHPGVIVIPQAIFYSVVRLKKHTSSSPLKLMQWVLSDPCNWQLFQHTKNIFLFYLETSAWFFFQQMLDFSSNKIAWYWVQLDFSSTKSCRELRPPPKEDYFVWDINSLDSDWWALVEITDSDWHIYYLMTTNKLVTCWLCNKVWSY